MLRFVYLLLLGVVAAQDSNQNPIDCTILQDCMSCQNSTLNASCHWFNGQCSGFNGTMADLAPCQGQQDSNQNPIDCTILQDCMSCQNSTLNASCHWFNGQCSEFNGTMADLAPCQGQQPRAQPKGGCRPACKINFQCRNGKCIARPNAQPRPQKGDCQQEGLPLIKNGDRFQNPLTCATLLCVNGSLGMLECASSRCPNGEIMQCDPNNKCLPAACGVTQEFFDCPAILGVPFIKHGTSWRDPLTCRTHTCNNGLVTLSDCTINICADGTFRLCDPVNSCIAPSCLAPLPTTAVVPAAPLGCLMQGGFPALGHGATWRDPSTCNTYECNNGFRIETFCPATACSNGEIHTCDPNFNCMPRACSPDCLASGEFPFLRHGQSYFDARTCNTYTCSNRVAVRESCAVSICSNGEVRPCDPNNRCLPMPCSMGTLLLPAPTSVFWPTTTFPLLPLTWGTADCPALGLIPYLRHGQSFTDMTTCTLRTCINGVTTSQASCVQNVCLGGVLQPCDPTNFCLSRLCPLLA